MTHDQQEWSFAKKEMIDSLTALGYPRELGDEIAKNLGSPKAMYRMMVYLDNVRPKTVDLVVDEMLAIRSEIEAWREKKACEEANEAYNDMLYYGLGTEEE